MEPMYQQIAASLRKEIELGRLSPGQQLPTELDLREHYGASRNTIRDAIKWLSALGLVETRPGQGTFVAQKIDPFVNVLSGGTETGVGGEEGISYLSEVNEQRRKPSTSPIQVEIQEAAGEIAAGLQIPKGSEVVSRHQRRYIDETPWSLQTSFYPMPFVVMGAERLMHADDITEGTVRYLAEAVGRNQVGYRDMINVRAPDAAEAGFFKIPLDGRVAVYEIFETAFDQDRTPMRLTVTVFPADRNRFVVNMGNVPVLGLADNVALT
jgi:GntR family transcriptional regulator